VKTRYRLLYRSERGTFFCFDKLTKKRTGLNTRDRDSAEQIVLAKNRALDGIRNKTIIETLAEDLLQALKAGTVSTNTHLRKFHNFCLSINWLPWPIIHKRLWPEITFKDKLVITREEHDKIIAREKNPERQDFYELCWRMGGSQSDIAGLETEQIDWNNKVIARFACVDRAPFEGWRVLPAC